MRETFNDYKTDNITEFLEWMQGKYNLDGTKKQLYSHWVLPSLQLYQLYQMETHAPDLTEKEMRYLQSLTENYLIEGSLNHKFTKEVSAGLLSFWFGYTKEPAKNKDMIAKVVYDLEGLGEKQNG